MRRYAALEPTLAQAPPASRPIYLCRSADFLGLTGVDIHRGCLALVERPRLSTIGEVLRRGIDGRRAGRRGESGQRRRHLSKRGGVWRGRGAAQPDLLRSALSKGDSHVDGGDAARAVRPVTPWPERLAALRDTGFAIAALTPRSRRRRSTTTSTGRGRLGWRCSSAPKAPASGQRPRRLADVRIRIPIRRTSIH